MEVNLRELAALVGGELQGPPERRVSGLKGLDQAGPEDVAFLANPKYAPQLAQCRAGVVLVRPDEKVPEGMAVIRVADPYLAYAKLLTAVAQPPAGPAGVHPRAVVDPSAALGKGVTVHALAYVGPGASVGDGAVLHPGAHLGAGASLGNGTVLHPNAVVYHGCKVGSRCIIHAGTVIGADGYGFVPDGERHFKIPQLGIVEIGDDVELGALCTVDRAAQPGGVTRIGDGTKMDNMVHVAHNCQVGENSLLVAQVGISGSTSLGRGVVIGGQAGIAGHLTIGDGAQLAGGTGVIKDVAPGEKLGGVPAMPYRVWLRTASLIRRLPELFKRVQALEDKASRG